MYGLRRCQVINTKYSETKYWLSIRQCFDILNKLPRWDPSPPACEGSIGKWLSKLSGDPPTSELLYTNFMAFFPPEQETSSAAYDYRKDPSHPSHLRPYRPRLLLLLRL